MIGEIEITPWWLRLIGRQPFRRYRDDYGGQWWQYLSFSDVARFSAGGSDG